MKNVLKFSKTGRMRFVGHLDLLRAFQRLFRKCGVNLKYSQGFNPHPQIAFASPLPLGFNGLEEVLEFETTDELANIPGLIEELNAVMPQGVTVLSIESYSDETRKPMGELCGCVYSVVFQEIDVDFEAELSAYLSQEEMPVTKTGKIRGRKTTMQVNYRPFIVSYELASPKLTLEVKMTPEGSFNPNNFLEAFYSSLQRPVNLDTVITREKLIFKD